MALQNLVYRLEADFTPMETAFKYIYEHQLSPAQAIEAFSTDRRLTEILSAYSDDLSAVREILSHLETAANLNDDIFFGGMEDVYLNIHARYMPVFRHKNQFFNIQYVIRGILKEEVSGQELTFRPGDICFIAPETVHALSVFDDETIVVNILIKRETFQSVFINLLNKEDIISDFFTRVSLCNSYYPYIYCRTGIEQELTDIVREMIAISDSQMRFRNRLLINKLEELFIHLLEKHEYDFIAGSTLGETDKKILPVLRYIQEHFRTVTLRETARYFNYSETYLSRLISQYSGRSFSQLVKTARMRYAAKLLEFSNMPIEDISIECGYEDRSHFHKTFRKEYGVTPKEYRKDKTTEMADSQNILYKRDNLSL
ncbi:MAG: helix-turn-helix domain-containing protein [Parasporobacterium sp.]|nr:helix-turn-helix domain-containing protein [Parasporobacterium sp.]